MCMLGDRAGAGRLILFLGRLKMKRNNRIKLKVILKNRLTKINYKTLEM